MLIYYYIYLVLHPKHKLKYFEKQNWDEDWVKTAEEIVQEEFKRNFAEYLANRRQKILSHLKKVSNRIISILFFGSRSFQSRNDDDDTDDSESSSSSSHEEEFAEELDLYRSSGRIKGVKDPIKWWHDNQGSYPRLSRMARD